MDAFKSTLSEVLEADLILRVVDISDENCYRELEAVNSVLKEIGASDNSSITVCNKIDKIEPSVADVLKRRFPDVVFCSARTGDGTDILLSTIARRAAEDDVLMSTMIPYSEGDLVAAAHRLGTVLQEEHTGDGTLLVCKVPRRLAASLRPYELL